MIEKILISESSKVNRMKVRESSVKPERTKIVVHINNYILTNDDSSRNVRPMSTRGTTATDVFELDFPKTDYRFNELNSQKKKKIKDDNEYMILKAKSLNFPVKIRSSYTIYQSSNLVDNNDKKAIDKNYSLMENKISNLINYEMYKRLPGSQTDQVNFNSLRQMFLKDKVSNPNSLPNYLRPNMNLQPTYSIISKSKSDSKLSNPIFSYKKLISDRSNNLVERFSKLESFLKKREKNSESNLAKIKINESKPEKEMGINEKNENQPLKDANKKSKNPLKVSSNYMTIGTTAKNKILMYVEPDMPRKAISTTDQFKLPYLMRSFDANEFALGLTNHLVNAAQAYDNLNEHSQLSNFNDDVDDKINKIVKSYPSIVLRRQNVGRFPKLKNYLDENHIKYDISLYKNTKYKKIDNNISTIKTTSAKNSKENNEPKSTDQNMVTQ